MRILAFALLVIGAVVAYGANALLKTFYKKDYGEKELAVLKTVGLLIALAGAIIIFVI